MRLTHEKRPLARDPSSQVAGKVEAHDAAIAELKQGLADTKQGVQGAIDAVHEQAAKVDKVEKNKVDSGGFKVKANAEKFAGPTPLVTRFVANATGAKGAVLYRWRFDDGTTRTFHSPNPYGDNGPTQISPYTPTQIPNP